MRDRVAVGVINSVSIRVTRIIKSIAARCSEEAWENRNDRDEGFIYIYIYIYININIYISISISISISIYLYKSK